MSAILEVRDLVKQFPKVRAVDGVTFDVPEGVCFGLLGPNGAGKTTTVEMLEGLVRPTSGAVDFRGVALGAGYRERIGIQFQHTALQQFLTVRENLNFFSRLYRKVAPLEQVIARCRLAGALARIEPDQVHAPRMQAPGNRAAHLAEADHCRFFHSDLLCDSRCVHAWPEAASSRCRAGTISNRSPTMP